MNSHQGGDSGLPLLNRLLQECATGTPRLGRVVQAIGTTIYATGISARIGQRCEIITPGQSQACLADVVGLLEGKIILYPLGPLSGISTQSSVRVLGGDRSLEFSESLIGCVLDGAGHVIRGSQPTEACEQVPLDAQAPDPLSRQPIERVFPTGVKAIDSLLTVGEGQRIGIFATAGGGKSTLLSMLARNAGANVDVVVIGMVGERGREVSEFIDQHLGEAGMARSVVVVATSDKPAMERLMAAQSATAIAEAFRRKGRRVLLLIDSVTRTARAMREIGLSIGEPPVRQGYPPSVFAQLPRLFERAGNDEHGTITTFYTVLVEDEDSVDAIADETRSILDGHIVLSRSLGESGHFPAIDVLASVSRLFQSLADETHRLAAQRVRALLAKHREIEFLVKMGEYEPGTDALADECLQKNEAINAFLVQGPGESLSLAHSIDTLKSLSQ